MRPKAPSSATACTTRYSTYIVAAPFFNARHASDTGGGVMIADHSSRSGDNAIRSASLRTGVKDVVTRFVL
jgi:hypothetical protein